MKVYHGTLSGTSDTATHTQGLNTRGVIGTWRAELSTRSFTWREEFALPRPRIGIGDCRCSCEDWEGLNNGDYAVACRTCWRMGFGHRKLWTMRDTIQTLNHEYLHYVFWWLLDADEAEAGRRVLDDTNILGDYC